MKLKFFYINVCLLFAMAAQGQDLHFSQFYNSPLTTNPANTGFIPDADYRIGATYRNQYSNIMQVPYTTFSAFADGKLFQDRLQNGWLGIGGVILSDKAGSGSLVSNKAYASIAYHQLLGYGSLLSAGFNLGYAEKRIDPSKLKFPDQFDGKFFDGTRTTSVILNNTKTSYFDMQVGLNYAYFPTENVYLNAGYSIHHVNRPRETFFAEKTAFGVIPMRQIAFANAILKVNSNIIINPNIYYTTQANSSELVGGLRANYNLSQNGVILKLSANVDNLLFSTFFGGNDDDACFVAAINPTDGNIYIGGSTGSSTLPGNTAGVLAASSNGGIDGFVTIISPNGASVIKTTFIGTSAVDMLFGLKFDKFGFPYVMGTTTSNSWQVINANYADAGAKQFIAKLKPDLSAYVYSTVFGTTNSVDPNISPIAFLVDRCQNVYVSGWGGGINKEYNPMGSTANLPETNPLAGIPPADGQDFYFFVLERDAQSRLFASHFGQSGGLGDHVDGGTSRFDENGIIYQAVCANCNREGSFPTTGGAWSVTNNSPSCNEAAVKIEMNFSGVSAKLQASINGDVNDTSACTGNTIVFKDILNKGKTFIFDFGDGSPRQTVAAPANTVSHIYNTVGVFRVMLIAEDLNTCNIRDTAYKNVRIGDNRAALSFNATKNPPCESLSYSFTNTTTVSVPNFTSNNFYWDYGDGSPIDTINGFAPNPATHTYAKIGTYTVKLFLQGDNFCNAPDSISQAIRVNPIVQAIFTTPAIGCAPYIAIFKNESLAGSSFQWQFENGTIFSTLSDPTYLFTTPGIFRVRLIANDPSTCNKTDTSAFFTITVLPKPMAGATWGPNPPIENVPVSFTNLSSPDAIRFKWFFGDGDSSTVTNPVHEYNATGTYKALLIAYNKLDCNDTFRLAVNVVILPLLDVPNAFTPGNNGENGVVKVRGFGITKLNWNVYNRWGQLMFSSNSKLIGWDGKYKGKLQPMDVYTYSLEAELATGEKIRKTGDITLLR